MRMSVSTASGDSLRTASSGAVRCAMNSRCQSPSSGAVPTAARTSTSPVASSSCRVLYVGSACYGFAILRAFSGPKARVTSSYRTESDDPGAGRAAG